MHYSLDEHTTRINSIMWLMKYYDGPNCDLIKFKDLLFIMGSVNKLKTNLMNVGL